jgi:TPR repeat protein
LAHFVESQDLPAPPIIFAEPTEVSSAILEGYANAMFNLGRRYEAGSAGSVNPREAVRCYCKAARLGNLLAMARLVSHWMMRSPGRGSASASSVKPSDQC